MSGMWEHIGTKMPGPGMGSEVGTPSAIKQGWDADETLGRQGWRAVNPWPSSWSTGEAPRDRPGVYVNQDGSVAVWVDELPYKSGSSEMYDAEKQRISLKYPVYLLREPSFEVRISTNKGYTMSDPMDSFAEALEFATSVEESPTVQTEVRLAEATNLLSAGFTLRRWRLTS